MLAADDATVKRDGGRLRGSRVDGAMPSVKVGAARFREFASAAPRAWESAMVKQLMSFGRKLCEDPRRKGYTSCLQFLDNTSERDKVAGDMITSSSDREPLHGLSWSAVTAWKTSIARSHHDVGGVGNGVAL